MTTQGRRRRADEPEGTPERDTSGRTAPKGRAGRPKLEPMQINEAKVIWIGIGLWAAAFLILLPFRKTLISDGHGWWLYTCLAGAGLGMVGLPMVGRRKAVIHRETERGRQVGHDEGGREHKGKARDAGRDAGRDGGRDGGRDNGRGRGRR
ncbi:hypothetical protein ABH926_008166 [Catenulispora sp. GP43]|uniref:DUF2530 domain-containing protein n=1 Tax=Catenulispora sp. GP43 TaxID=3156263 RepID=UPI0035188568